MSTISNPVDYLTPDKAIFLATLNTSLKCYNNELFSSKLPGVIDNE
jgi:hypothetical protein